MIFKIWIAPHGDDTHPGTYDRPVKTFDGALDRIPKSSFLDNQSFISSKDVYKFHFDERETPSTPTPEGYTRSYTLTREAIKRSKTLNGSLHYAGGMTNEFGDMKISDLDKALNHVSNPSLDLFVHNCFKSSCKGNEVSVKRTCHLTKIYMVDGLAKGQQRNIYQNDRSQVTVWRGFDPWPAIGDTFRVCRDSVILVSESESLP